jgi:hypothetical protein
MKHRNIFLVLVLMSFCIASFAAVIEATPPGLREALPEYKLEPILIYDGEGDLLKITIEDLAEATGEELWECVCRPCTFRVTKTAISQLYEGEEYPTQGELKVVYHHPSRGHRLSFNYLLTEDCCTLEMPPGTSRQKFTIENYAYEFIRTDTGETFKTRVKVQVFPEGFFVLREKVKSKTATPDEKAEFAKQWSDVRDKFLVMNSYDLFEGVEEAEEETEEEVPNVVGGATFFSILVAGLILLLARL